MDSSVFITFSAQLGKSKPADGLELDPSQVRHTDHNALPHGQLETVLTVQASSVNSPVAMKYLSVQSSRSVWVALYIYTHIYSNISV